MEKCRRNASPVQDTGHGSLRHRHLRDHSVSCATWLNQHLYRPKHVFEVMTIGKEDDSELIAPETTDDLISVSNKAKAYCEALDRGVKPTEREERVNGRMETLAADTTSSAPPRKGHSGGPHGCPI